MKDTVSVFSIILPRLHCRKATVALALLALSTLNPQLSTVLAQGTTAFTYQGKLSSGANAANGIYDLRFAIYDAAIGSDPVGGPVTNAATAVTNGYFTVALDFGSVFNGNARWLEMAVRTNGGGTFTTLTPRQALTPAPYSLFAANSALLSGQAPSAYAPASGSTAYVAKSGDTMTGSLNLPANGLVAGGSQLVLSGGNVGIGTASPQNQLHVANSAGDSVVLSQTLLADHAAAVRVAAPGGFGELGFGGTNYPVWGGPLSLNLVNVGSGPLTFNHFLGGAAIEHMRITSTGKVGIGTANPDARLNVENTGGDAVIKIRANTSGASYLDLDSASGGYGGLSQSLNGANQWRIGAFGDAVADIHFYTYVGGTPYSRMTVLNNGNVGIGTTTPDANLTINGSAYSGVESSFVGTHISNSADGGDATLWLQNSAKNAYIRLKNNYDSTWLKIDDGTTTRMVIGDNGNVGIGTASPATTLDVAGAVTVRGNLNVVSASDGSTLVQLGEGLDYAEGFDVAEAAKPAPGTVLVIDADHAGKLAVSHEAYDRTVAGIVAGGQGLGSAVRAGVGRFDCTVALAGRVFCNVDATFGGVVPGDLLTTSPTAGYAMVVKDVARAQGAILGKAMQKLAPGEKGQILVLVTLQ